MKKLFLKTGLLCLFSAITGMAWGDTDATATWTFDAGTEGQVATFSSSSSEYFKSSYVTLGSALDYKGTGSYTLNGTSITYTKIQPSIDNESVANDATNAIDFLIAPRAGMTFTPTNVSFNAIRFGTDGGKMDIYWLNDDNSKVELETGKVAGRENSSTENPNYEFSYDLTSNSEAKGSTGACGLHINLYSLGSSKQYGFANIVITGTLSGDLTGTPLYTLTLNVSPDGAGTITQVPGGSTFEQGDEVTLTQTRNAGYSFTGWADEDGTILSSDDSYTVTINSDTSITATYRETTMYSLTVELDDSGAKDYMISYDPEPTVIDEQNMYEEGTIVALTASSNSILTFTNWSNGETYSTTTVTMNADQTITANYSAVDYIAGWDFYTSSNGSRIADFAAENNETDALIMRDDDGNTTTWLDKSYENTDGAVYEDKQCAVNWTTSGLGKYYWQTKVNAAAFTDIKVSSSMLYNYNSYTTYNLQYSTDNSTWTTAGTITLSTNKVWYTNEISLPEEANNQEELYIRWYPDTNGGTAGSSGDNDGISITEIFITGTAAIQDDGTAPELVSTVPENNGTGASANGKIVLTFDEKVQVAEGTTATLGSLELTPTVSGKTVMFNYKGLEYTTEYTFTLPANTVSDLSGNTLTDAITITFSTKTKPTVTKQLYDFIVPDDGDITAAFEAANTRSNTSDRYRIFIKKGDYTIPASTTATVTGSDGNTYASPITELSAPNVSIIGEDMDETTVVNTVPSTLIEGANAIEGLSNCETFSITSNATSTYFQDITIKNGLADGTGRGAALEDSSDKTICMNVCLYGYQDTYYSRSSKRYYFEGGKLRGRTDFLCGRGDIFFNGVELVMCESGGYITAPSIPKEFGYIFRDCTISGEGTISSYTLGRPWGSGTPICLYINTTMNIIPSSDGWSEMSGGWPARMAEYNSMTSNGSTVDLSGRKTTFADSYTNNPILTAQEASLYTVDYVMAGDDDWDPTDATEQASAPQNVVISGTSLTWDTSDYVLCWAICQDGDVIDFTTDNSYTVEDTSSTYSVRAANEMGGLGEATTATTSDTDGIKEIGNAASGSILRTSFYNLQGARVSNSYKGVVIKVDTMSDGKQVATKIIK